MSFEIYCEIPDTVLCLKIIGHVSITDFVQINNQINNYLDVSGQVKKVILKIDTLEAESIPRNIESLRSSQTYANRHTVKWLLVIGNDKFIRLMMLLTFNMSQSILRFADNDEHADRFLRNFLAFEKR